MPKELIKRVRKIEIKTKCLVDSLLQGSYRSVFKGRGIEFSDIREYKLGDDIRNIDWNVTARTGRLHIKEFVEERDLSIYLLFDVSASNEFGSNKTKKQVAMEIAASLVFAAIRNNDNIALCLFSNKVERFIPLGKGKKHAFMIIREMIRFKPKEKRTDITNAIRFIARIARKRGIIFIISDFISNYEFLNKLKLLCYKHDVILIHLYDPSEIQIADVGYLLFEDAETGEQILVNTSSKEFRDNYRKNIEKKEREMENKLKKLGIDRIKISSNEDFEIPLRKFFAIRLRRIR